ncbi:MAG TPA: peptidylprolyl isomerase [Acidiferrobacterales bacterium]|nr:peptidylprolyl isomerase [Acidiferrobacterales bacterium]
MLSTFPNRLFLVLFGVLLAFPPAGMTHAALAASTEAADPIDRILIVVNDEIITAREVDTRVSAVRARLTAQKVSLPPDDILRRQVMERMVTERLQQQLARQLGFTVSDERLDRAIRQVAEQNHKSPEDLRRESEKEPGGYRAFREELRGQLLVQQLIEREVNNRVNVSEAEVENFLAAQSGRDGGVEYNISHILLGLPESASPEVIARARLKAEGLLADLRKGADFGQLAVANSQGQNALEGGGLGWKQAGQLPDLFVNVLRTLKPGTVSDVLRSPSGFHILRLNDRRGGGEALKVTQTRARHILIKTGELVSLSEAQRRIEQLRERLVNGANFAETARAHSEDVGSAANGGDLSWMSPGQTVPEFEKAMNALKPGELSAPVKSPFGVHLIQVQERRERDVSQEREAATARNQLHARKADERYEQWLRQLRDEAFVEYRLEVK